MRVRRFLLTVALVTALIPGEATHADLNYRAEITGAENSELASLLDKVSELKTLEDKPPVSEEALRHATYQRLQSAVLNAEILADEQLAIILARLLCREDGRLRW